MNVLRRTELRLFRHDWCILENSARATFAAWHDRLIAGLILLVVLASLQARIADLPARTAAWAAAAAGLTLGAAAGSAVRRRIAFHSYDGVLAGDALHRSTRRLFIAAWHVVGALLLLAVLLIVDAALLGYGIPAYAVGAAASAIPVRALPWRLTRPMRWRRTVTERSRSPCAGAAAAIALLLSIWALSDHTSDVLVPFVGIEALLLSLALTPVDDRVARFMAASGKSAERSVARHAAALMAFAAIAAPAAWLVSEPAVALATCAASALAGLVLMLRILAYRLHGRRTADLLVAVVTGLLAMVAYAMPPALPVAVVVALWHLRRRAAAKTWLLS